jgi:hypothetical protein
MKSKITKKQNGIDIDITEIEGKKNELLQAFQECSEGRCTCPTNEYEKVEKMDIEDANNSIKLSIIVKDGDKIDTKEIEKCLEYTKKRVSE